MGYRAICMVFMLVTGLLYLLNYARKIKANPKKSLLHDVPQKFTGDVQVKALSTREKAAGIAFLALMGYMLFGTLTMGFGFTEMAGVFIAVR